MCYFLCKGYKGATNKNQMLEHNGIPIYADDIKQAA